MPWVREARRRLPRNLRARIECFRFFFEPGAEVFPLLWGQPGLQPFDAELRGLQKSLGAYRDAVVRRLGEKRLLTLEDLCRMRSPRWYRTAAVQYARRFPKFKVMLERFVESPAQSLREFCAMLDDFNESVFLPGWKPIGARLVADIAMRKKVLSRYGVGALLRTLAQDIVVSRTREEVSIHLPPGDAVLELDARAIVTLTPSFFCWPAHEAFVLQTPSGVRCTIAYPIPPLTAEATQLDEDGTLVHACAALGDLVRLRIMELLNARDLSTRELAGFLKLAEPAVSRHLRELLRAGLVQQRRSGYFVMYSVRRDAVRKVTAALAALH